MGSFTLCCSRGSSKQTCSAEVSPAPQSSCRWLYVSRAILISSLAKMSCFSKLVWGARRGLSVLVTDHQKSVCFPRSSGRGVFCHFLFLPTLGLLVQSLCFLPLTLATQNPPPGLHNTKCLMAKHLFLQMSSKGIRDVGW